MPPKKTPSYTIFDQEYNDYFPASDTQTRQQQDLSDEDAEGETDDDAPGEPYDGPGETEDEYTDDPVQNSEPEDGEPESEKEIPSTGGFTKTKGAKQTLAFSTRDHNNKAVYVGYSAAFRGPLEAEKFLLSVHERWKPNDDSQPDITKKEGKRWAAPYVERVYNAMTNMTQFNDRPTECGKRSVLIMKPMGLSAEEVQVAAWRVVRAAMSLHREGSCIFGKTDISNTIERGYTFEERIQAIEKTCKEWKATVQDCLDSDVGLERLVHGPRSVTTRKANNSRNNMKKAKDLKAGAEKRKAEQGSADEDPAPRKRGRKAKPRARKEIPSDPEERKRLLHAALDAPMPGEWVKVKRTPAEQKDDLAMKRMLADLRREEEEYAQEDEG